MAQRCSSRVALGVLSYPILRGVPGPGHGKYRGSPAVYRGPAGLGKDCLWRGGSASAQPCHIVKTYMSDWGRPRLAFTPSMLDSWRAFVYLPLRVGHTIRRFSIGGTATVSTKDLYAVPDGQTLVTLATGIEIVRRRKHEPISIDGLDTEQLVSRTGKKSGSKFLPGTTLAHIVRYTEEILTENSAVLHSSGTYTKTFADDVGIAGGIRVRTMQVLFDGRYAHAFPIAS